MLTGDSYTIAYLLDRAKWAVNAFWVDALKAKGIDLPHSQYIIMRFLFERDGMSQKEIASILHKDVSAIKRSIDNLEKKGLVERRRVTGCKYGICLTQKGHDLRADITEAANTVLGESFGLSEEDRKAGVRFLEAIYRSYVKKKE